MRLAGCTVVACALFAVACGGEDRGPRPEPNYCNPLLPVSDTPDLGGGPADCNALDGLELFLIDDFETGTARPGWYLNNDRTAESDPVPDTDPPPTTPIPGGRCVGAEPSDDPPMLCASSVTPRGECSESFSLESRHALHIRTGNLSANGGQLGRNLQKQGCIAPNPADPSTVCPFRAGPPEIGPCPAGGPEVAPGMFAGMGPSPPYYGCNAVEDMGEWDGVMVWARKAYGSQTGVRIRVSDVNTDEAACRCNPYTNENDTSDGCDKFGSFTALEDTFRAYLMPFDLMQQGGWGMNAPGIDRSEILSVGIEYGRGSWDLWIDDVAFYRRKR